MPAAKKEATIFTDKLATTDETGMQGQKSADSKRRLADSIDSKGRKLKLDRRLDQNDRRLDTASEYNGPGRRKTIDQRENLKDRRSEG